MAERKTFAREATGLVREIGLWTGVILILCNVIGGGWQKRVFQVTGWAPVHNDALLFGLPPLAMAFFIVGVIVFLTVYVFSVLSAAMPRAGGGYVFISRLISPPIGFVAAWVEFLAIAISYGLIAVAVTELAWIFLSIVGFNLDPLMTTTGLAGTGLVFGVAFAAIGAMGVRMSGRILQLMFVIPAIITVAIYLMLITATPAAMEAGIKAITGHAAIDYTKAALAQGMTAHSYWGSVGVAIIGAYWAYIGYAAVSFVGGEVKESNINLPKQMFYASAIIMGVYVTISFFLARAAGMAGVYQNFSFFQAFGFLNYGGGSFADAGLPTNVLAWMPVVATFSAVGKGLAWLAPLIGIAGVFWLANDLPPFVLTSSRTLFAMAFDRALPEWIANISEKYHSPINAIVITLIVSLVGVASESGIMAFNGVLATDLMDGIFFTLVCVAAIRFPSKMPEVYAKAPWKHKIGGMEAIVVVGWLALIGNLYLDYIFMTNEHDAINPFDWPEGFWFVVGTVVLGFILFYGTKAMYKKENIDYDTIFAEIPPE
ncbi:MAG: APC family permease [Candidatus Methanofastidiosia archaeon]